MIRFNPIDAQAYVSKAHALLNLCFYDLARRDLNSAINITPNFIPAITAEIILAFKENKIAVAQKKLLELLSIDSTNEWALENILSLTINQIRAVQRQINNANTQT